MNEPSTLADALDQLNASGTVLNADVRHCIQQMHGEDARFWRRCLVRAIFAEVEGVIFGYEEPRFCEES